MSSRYIGAPRVGPGDRVVAFVRRFEIDAEDSTDRRRQEEVALRGRGRRRRARSEHLNSDRGLPAARINPFVYLRDVFAGLPSMTNWQVKEITPGWLKARTVLKSATA